MDVPNNTRATYKISNNGSTKTLINYQQFTDRTYDSSHNVINQKIVTFVDPGSLVTDFTNLSQATFSSCEEVRSSGFTPSGVAASQTIVDYSDKNEGSIIDVKVVSNSNISANGNVGTSVVTTYGSATISADLSTITPTGDPISRQTTTTAANAFDIYGNAAGQTIFSVYWQMSKASIRATDFY